MNGDPADPTSVATVHVHLRHHLEGDLVAADGTRLNLALKPEIIAALVAPVPNVDGICLALPTLDFEEFRKLGGEIPPVYPVLNPADLTRVSSSN